MHGNQRGCTEWRGPNVLELTVKHDPINPVLETNQSSRRTEGPIYRSSGSTAHLNAFWYPFCFPWKERFHYTFFFYWREDSAEGKSDGSKIKRWQFNYRTLIKASGWWLCTRPPLIVPPDVLIKWDCSGGGKKKKVTGPTQSRDAARWEFGNKDVPDRQKWRRISKQSALNIPRRGPPDEIMERPGFHPRHIISIGQGKRGHRSSDATENSQSCESCACDQLNEEETSKSAPDTYQITDPDEPRRAQVIFKCC